MESLLDLLKEKELELTNVIESANHDLHPTTDRVNVSTYRGKHYYYLRRAGEKPKYLPKKDHLRIPELVQNEYSSHLLPLAYRQRDSIHQTIQLLEESPLYSVYDDLHPGKKIHTRPYAISDEEYAAAWAAESYESNPVIFDEEEELFSERGERVRSKSEMIIADRLYHSGIPYRYEAPLMIPPNQVFYPDFTVLNTRTRQVFYWEHLGIMDDPDYVRKSLYKLDQYSSIGIIIGKNLILTYETGKRPLNVKNVSRILSELLL